MKKREIKNYGRSVKDRLLTVSKESGIPYMTILVRYIQERLLYRVAQSEYRDNFFLKGGALLYAFNQEKARPTKDIDFLGTSISNDEDYIKSIFAQITAVPCDEDGIVFDKESIAIEDITQDKDYNGLRLTLKASLDSIRQPISMDIGFGDVVTPGPQDLQYPLLLEDVPGMSVLAYSLETVVAEKFEAMVSLSVNNSRMKDFFDVYGILNGGKLDKEVLTDAIKNTFQNRGTSYVENHPLFTDDFYKDTNRIARWKGFLKGINWQEDIPFEIIGQTIKSELSGYWEMLKPEQ
jgi:predicted nucleotidyltransferase component of viral defense system